MSLSSWALGKLGVLPVVLVQHWAYPLLLLFSFCESIPFLGLVIPGHTAVLLGGFLAKMGYLDLWAVLVIVFLATALGDTFSYEFGRRYGHAFLLKYGKRFFFHEEEYREVRRLLAAHPGKTIILGKFHTLTKTFTPFIAGASQMGRVRFQLCSLTAAALWTSCFVLIGYIFGHGFEQAAKYVGTFALIALLFALFLFFGYRRAQRFVLKYQHRLLRYPVGLMLLASSSLVVLGVVADNIADHGSLLRLDALAHDAIPAIRSPLLTAISVGFDASFGLYLLGVVCIALFIILVFLERRRSAAIFAAMIGLGFATEQGIKLLGLHPRPGGGIVAVLTGSFPSGHATMATIFCLFLFWAFRDDFLHRLSRVLFETAMLSLPFLVGLSRVYLSVHWVSDIIGGWALGLFIFAAVLAGAHLLRPRAEPRRTARRRAFQPPET